MKPISVIVLTALAAVLAVLFMPVILVWGMPVSIQPEQAPERTAEAEPAADPESTAELEQTAAGPFKPYASEAPTLETSFDQSVTVRLLVGQEVQELTMEDYLVGVVLAEMPASFEMEALRAQAVAARTHTLKNMGSGKHPDADVCAEAACCKAYLSQDAAKDKLGQSADYYLERIRESVTSTDGLVVEYQGIPIDAAFFSCSNGYTEAAVDVWGNDVAYLQSVESPGEEASPRFYDSVEVGYEVFQDAIEAAYEDAVFSQDPNEWIGEAVRTGAGGVVSIEIGSVPIRGAELRGLFGLRSTCFEIELTDNSVVFHTQGYGHRVGMSQYGANAMAKSGSTFEEILKWYYTGTEIVRRIA